MTRLPTFDANVTAPIIRHVLRGDGDPLGVLEEVIRFACPFCGHLTVDHTWTPGDNDQHRCLMRQNTMFNESESTISSSPLCECPGFSSAVDSGALDLVEAEMLEHLEQLFGVVIGQDQKPRLHARQEELIAKVKEALAQPS